MASILSRPQCVNRKLWAMEICTDPVWQGVNSYNKHGHPSYRAIPQFIRRGGLRGFNRRHESHVPLFIIVFIGLLSIHWDIFILEIIIFRYGKHELSQYLSPLYFVPPGKPVYSKNIDTLKHLTKHCTFVVKSMAWCPSYESYIQTGSFGD